MYTLKGIFPEPKKDQKKNFIRENMKQLKFVQSRVHTEPKFTLKNVQPPRLTNPIALGSLNTLGQVKSSPSSRSGKVSLNVNKFGTVPRSKKLPEVHIKKGDMAEFLKRKEMRNVKVVDESAEEDAKSTESSGRLRDIGCQTIESNLTQKQTENAKLTILYPKKDEDAESKLKASGDNFRHKSPSVPPALPQRSGDTDLFEADKRNRLNSILERKDNKDPYLPSGYQKGVVPKYIRERKDLGPKEAEGAKADEAGAMCPPGHVTLPDTERKETLRMLRNSFAELVSELNKMPVKTDTLRMRNRKMELEKQLAKLEEGIKVFSRPKVFVKIGE